MTRDSLRASLFRPLLGVGQGAKVGLRFQQDTQRMYAERVPTPANQYAGEPHTTNPLGLPAIPWRVAACYLGPS